MNLQLATDARDKRQGAGSLKSRYDDFKENYRAYDEAWLKNQAIAFGSRRLANGRYDGP